VKVALTLPDGLKLKSGDTSVTVGSLAAGESKTISLTATATDTSSPKTGDDSSLFLWIGLLIISAGILAALLAHRRKKAFRALSLLLCLALAASAMAPSMTASAATVQKNFTVSETVKVDGTNKTITAKVTYDWDDTASDPEPTTYDFTAPSAITANGVTATVTFDKESPQTAGTNVTATVTLSGTAAKAGVFTIDLTSANAGLTTNPQTKTVTVGAQPNDTYDFTFTMPDESVSDFVLTFNFIEDTYEFTAPAAQATNGVTATVTFDPASPRTAGTQVKATVTLSGTAAKAGEFTIDLTSANAELTTNPQTKTVTVGAQPNDTYDFTFTMPDENVSDFVLTFSFVEATYTIAMTNDGNGMAVAKVGDISTDKAIAGATVTIAATPTGDYAFKRWTVISGGVTLSSTTTNPATFTMGNEAVEIKAEFEAIPRTVTMTGDGHGTAVADPADATAGTEVTITATPEGDYAFKQWTVVSGGVTLSGTTTNPATFTMGSEAVEIRAEFTMSADAVAQATTLAYNAGKSAGANTVYTFALPAAAPGATIATATVTCNGNPVASSLAGTGNIDLTFTDDVLAALPYDKDLIVIYTVTYGGQTSAANTRTIPASQIAAMADIIAVRKASANAEAAKITGYTAGTNSTNVLAFNPTINGALTSGTTFQLIAVKTGANVGTATVLGNSSIYSDYGVLFLNTKNTIEAADLTYVGVTFTATLNGVTSNEQTLNISDLFGISTTAGKLRTDKAKFPRNGSVIGNYTFTNGTSLNTYYSLSPAVPLSNGVAFSPVAGFISGGGLDINANQLSLKADAGGDIRIAFAEAPTRNGNCIWQDSNIVLTCDGTSYSCSGIDFLVMIFVN